MAEVTLDRFWTLSEIQENRYLMQPVSKQEYFSAPTCPTQLLSTYRNVGVVADDELPSRATKGLSYTCISVDTYTYQKALFLQFQEAGGRVFRKSIHHLNEILECGMASSVINRMRGDSFQPPLAIVLCLGLDARGMGGIEDKKVYPIRRCNIKLKAPWIKCATAFNDGDGCTLSITPLPSGEVVISGPQELGDWLPIPRPSECAKILKDALDHFPELSMLPNDSGSQPLRFLQTLIKDEYCDMFAGRKGGPRIERDIIRVGRLWVPVIYDYGHGLDTMATLWGCATVVNELIQEGLSRIEQGLVTDVPLQDDSE
ncbi:hypothetical protein BKA70DRAFT_1427772 [Coprinopsis sp. MPI-PUGE-AT-0042]|nr:hypothetical protein BKA70DRAFT_1427772 [Coprinopsis sp. MPI-PUGE-AT-0042]